MQDLLIGIVSGIMSGVVAAAIVAWIAAGVTTGVWNLKMQINRVRDIVPKENISKRWAAWLEYIGNVSSLPPKDHPLFQKLVWEINTEFTSSYPHPNFPPGSAAQNFAALPLPEYLYSLAMT